MPFEACVGHGQFPSTTIVITFSFIKVSLLERVSGLEQQAHKGAFSCCGVLRIATSLLWMSNQHQAQPLAWSKNGRESKRRRVFNMKGEPLCPIQRHAFFPCVSFLQHHVDIPKQLNCRCWKVVVNSEAGLCFFPVDNRGGSSDHLSFVRWRGS